MIRRALNGPQNGKIQALAGHQLVFFKQCRRFVSNWKQRAFPQSVCRPAISHGQISATCPQGRNSRGKNCDWRTRQDSNL
jgi:hypothetical protein